MALPVVVYGDKHAYFLKLRHKGTNEWIKVLQQFTSWQSQPNSACICCYGTPGSGKSMLAASVVDYLQNSSSDDS